MQTLRWQGGLEGSLFLIDQTLLPTQCQEIECRTVECVWEAIRSLRVRGAPAIGVAAAYGTCLGLEEAARQGEAALLSRVRQSCEYLASSRPTAVNLFWALDRMRNKAEGLAGSGSPQQTAEALLNEARAIEEEDRQMCRAIGRVGAELLVDGQGVLTHCN